MALLFSSNMCEKQQSKRQTEKKDKRMLIRILQNKTINMRRIPKTTTKQEKKKTPFYKTKTKKHL